MVTIAGNVPVGTCCYCELTDSEGTVQHVDHYQLFHCTKPDCEHWTCLKHRSDKGYCEGCEADGE